MEPILNVKVFEKYMEDNHLSKTAFCEKCNISPATLNKILSGNNNLRFAPLYRIYYATGIALADMMNDKKELDIPTK